MYYMYYICFGRTQSPGERAARGINKKFNVGPRIGIRPSEVEEAANQTTKTRLHKKERERERETQQRNSHHEDKSEQQP